MLESCDNRVRVKKRYPRRVAFYAAHIQPIRGEIKRRDHPSYAEVLLLPRSLCYEGSRCAKTPGDIMIVSMPLVWEETVVLERAVEKKTETYGKHPPDHYLIYRPWECVTD